MNIDAVVIDNEYLVMPTFMLPDAYCLQIGGVLFVSYKCFFVILDEFLEAEILMERPSCVDHILIDMFKDKKPETFVVKYMDVIGEFMEEVVTKDKDFDLGDIEAISGRVQYKGEVIE